MVKYGTSVSFRSLQTKQYQTDSIIRRYFVKKKSFILSTISPYRTSSKTTF